VIGASGNIFQWTEDCFVEGGYAGAPTDGSARTVPGCELRVIRGGSWLNSSRGLRSAMRDRDRQRDRYTNVGFRIARDP
jgi:formylglycine-generating enzyme required for sulfatase activity